MNSLLTVDYDRSTMIPGKKRTCKFTNATTTTILLLLTLSSKIRRRRNRLGTPTNNWTDCTL